MDQSITARSRPGSKRSKNLPPATTVQETDTSTRQPLKKRKRTVTAAACPTSTSSTSSTSSSEIPDAILTPPPTPVPEIPSASSACKILSLNESSEVYPDIRCSICMDTMKEPTITSCCAHTFCKECILRTIDTCMACPNCGTPNLTKDKLIPNFSLGEVLNRWRKRKTVSTTVNSERTSSEDAVENLLRPMNLEKISPNDMDRLLLVLQRQRGIVALNDKEHQRKLLVEFLSRLKEIKGCELEKLKREMALINRDMLNCGKGSDVSNGTEIVEADQCIPSSSYKQMKLDHDSGSSGLSQHISQLEGHVQSSHKRMYTHFNELMEVYFNSMNLDLFDDRTQSDATMVDKVKLDNFGKILSHVAQYHRLKPVARLAYVKADVVVADSNNNMISSIAFDKDNEFFAIAGLAKVIKVFEYGNVISFGNDPRIHCSTTEFKCEAKISCVSWNGYFKNKLASSEYTGCVTEWDLGTGAKIRFDVVGLIRSLDEHTERVWSVDWSKGDPRLLASGSDDFRVKLWCSNSKGSIANLKLNANVTCVKFCPEGSYEFTVGSADHCVHHYDFRNLKDPICSMYGHKKSVSYVDFTGKDELVSMSIDNTLKLWSLNDTMAEIKTFAGHVNRKHFVGLTTDGDYIACGSENNSLYLYYKLFPNPLLSFTFENLDKVMLQKPSPDELSGFVSALAWKKGSPVMLAGNNKGAVYILHLE